MAGSGWQEIWQQGDGYDDCDDNGYLYDVKICSKLIMYLSNGIYVYICIYMQSCDVSQCDRDALRSLTICHTPCKDQET